MKDNGKTIGIVAVIVMALQLLLIAITECGFIDWAWGWVLAPLWMTATACATNGEFSSVSTGFSPETIYADFAGLRCVYER